MQRAFLLLALLFTVAPLALADTIKVSFDASILVNIDSPNDNFYGEYNSVSQHLGYPSIGMPWVEVNIADFSLLLPTGSLVTSADTKIITPTGRIEGTGHIYVQQGLIPPEPGAPSIFPTFTDTGSSYVLVDFVHGAARPIIDGNKVSLVDASVVFGLVGAIQGFLATPGLNSDCYIGGNGQVTIPYTVELDVTYSPAPVPEPCTLALLATGVLGMTGVIRRRITKSNSDV